MTSKIPTEEHLLVKPGIHIFFQSIDHPERMFEGYMIGTRNSLFGVRKLYLWWRRMSPLDQGSDGPGIFVDGSAQFPNFDWYLWERRPNADPDN